MVRPSNPPLDIFLSMLKAGLHVQGIPEKSISAFLSAIPVRAKQPPLATVEDYREGWLACHVATYILYDGDDGSEAAQWLHALSHAVFDYEDAFETKHGYAPLNAGKAGWTNGPSGRA